jgi:serine/threonine protein kinase
MAAASRSRPSRPTPFGAVLAAWSDSDPKLAATSVPGLAPLDPPGATPPDLPAELINHPKFRIIRELGRGGMGVVYPGLIDHPRALERLRAEVRAAARLDHPNIVRAYDAEQAGNLHLFVMELVEGTSLLKWMHRKGGVPVTFACRCVQQGALGLQHAFEQGMVHRDLKPQNLMISSRHKQVKVLDFGLAHLASERAQGRKNLTEANVFMGTPEYVAPEQATDARNADIRADIYSLGCTLYALLAGRPPFSEETALQTILAHLEKDPEPLPGLRPDVSEGLWAVAARMLAKNPAERYQTPVEVVRALHPFAAGSTSTSAASKPACAPDLSGAAVQTALPADTDSPPCRTGRKPPPGHRRAAGPRKGSGSPWGKARPVRGSGGSSAAGWQSSC